MFRHAYTVTHAYNHLKLTTIANLHEHLGQIDPFPQFEPIGEEDVSNSLLSSHVSNE